MYSSQATIGFMFIAHILFGISKKTYNEINEPNKQSPFHQSFPDCTKPYNKIQKQTTSKAVLCPMIKDEEGFLSEWVAYYQMHGFDRIDIFDHGSTDNYKKELQPWISSGYVRIFTNWTKLLNQPKLTFLQTITIKKNAETLCKRNAIQDGYQYFFSLDIDEYLLPIKIDVTIIDEMERFVNTTKRFSLCMEKLNFQVSPHILEPVHLLTIEAYQSRMKSPSKMSYYTSVAHKCAYVLTHASYSNITESYISECCNFHGCKSERHPSHFCKDSLHKSMITFLNGGHKERIWYAPFIINHYSRSLEKFALKSKTWSSATGEVAIGSTVESASKGYNTPTFLARNLGWYFDDTALRYSCQLRHQLRMITGESTYLRPGNGWYRNVEFGKVIDDSEKRGRYGRTNPKGFRYSEHNPYHYHGKQLGDVVTLTPNPSTPEREPNHFEHLQAKADFDIITDSKATSGQPIPSPTHFLPYGPTHINIEHSTSTTPASPYSMNSLHTSPKHKSRINNGRACI
eukprot:gene7380-15070_t